MAVMGAAPRFPVSRKAAKGRAADSRQVGAGFLVIRRRGHRTSMRADSRERPLHQVANVCTRLVPAIPSSQVTGGLSPVAAGFRFNSGFHCSIETDEPVGPHFQQQIPDTLFCQHCAIAADVCRVHFSTITACAGCSPQQSQREPWTIAALVEVRMRGRREDAPLHLPGLISCIT